MENRARLDSMAAASPTLYKDCVVLLQELDRQMARTAYFEHLASQRGKEYKRVSKWLRKIKVDARQPEYHLNSLDRDIDTALDVVHGKDP